MAPMPNSNYFPPLEPCLNSEQFLIAWQDAYSALCDPNFSKFAGLDAFLADTTARSLLQNPLKPFSPASAASKSQFETLTAAINITPAENAPYDIKRIKEDALWLAGEARVDEVTALRIVVLEWQKSPANRILLDQYDNDLSNPARNGTFSASVFHASIAAKPEGLKEENTITSSFDLTPQRRTRLLRLYLSEKLHIIKVSELLFRSHTFKTKSQTQIAGSSSLVDGGSALLESLCPEREVSSFLLKIAQSFQARVDGLDRGPGWASLEEVDATLSESWTETELLEIQVILQYIFDVSVIDVFLPSAESVSRILEVLSNVGFFASLPESPTSNLPYIGTSIRTAAQLAALALLRFPIVLQTMAVLSNEDLDAAPPTPDASYMWTPEGMKNINSIFMDLAEKGVEASASSMFAWSLIGNALSGFAPTSRRGSEDSIGGVSCPALPQQQGTNSTFDVLARVFNSMVPESKPEFIQTLAVSAADHLGLFGQIAEIGTWLTSSFGDAGCDSYKKQARVLLLQLMELVVPIVVPYSEQTVGAILALLDADRPYWDFAHESIKGSDVLSEFVVGDNRGLISTVFSEALSRYPDETTPLYRLMKSVVMNGHMDNELMEKMSNHMDSSARFTKRFPPDFQGYTDVVTDEDDDLLDEGGSLPQAYRLSQDLPWFVSRRQGQLTLSSSRAASSGELALRDQLPSGLGCVPIETFGIVVNDNRPITIEWDYQYSPLDYMVCSLYTALEGNDWTDVSTGVKLPLEDVCDILRLLATLILTTHNQQSVNAGDDQSMTARSLVEARLVDADPDKDLLNIVSDLFEDHLQLQQEQPGHEESIAVLVCCVEFFHAVTASVPNRIWPVLARSKLIDIDGNGGGLVAVVTAVEMITGTYDFLKSCVHLFEMLVEVSLKPGSESSSQSSKALTRFNSQATRQPGGEVIPQRIASAVVTSLSRTLTSVFSNSRSWRYTSTQEQAEISTRLATIFDRVLHYTYGFDDESNLQNKVVTAVLADSSNHLVDVLLSDSPASLLSNSLLDMLGSGLSIILDEKSSMCKSWQINQIISALALCATGLRIGVFSDRSTSAFEKHLYTAAPVLARLFASQEALRGPVATLLEALVTSAARSQAEPPSLLGHMGSGPAKDFLSILGHLGRPLNNIHTELKIWDLLSAVVRSRQQWFAISLLTGNAPRDRRKQRKEDKQEKVHGKPLLVYALDRLANIADMEPKLQVAMTRFVALCQNHWSWAVGSLRTHQNFVTGLTNYVRGLKREDSDAPLHICSEAAAAAAVAEVLAMHLHTAFQIGDYDASKTVIPHLQYFKKYGVSAPTYNASLHANLESYMGKDFGGLRPSNFKHTLAFPTEYGTNYFYDLPFASKVLNLRRTQKGKALQGIEKELEHANASLSLVEAQIHLMEKWKLLLLELSKSLRHDASVIGLLIEVVRKCLEENANFSVPQAIFDRLRFKRLDLALVLLQRLVVLDIKDASQEKELRGLFKIAWKTIIASDPDFENAFQSSDVQYYRTLLQILFLCLKPLVRYQPPWKNISSIKGTQRPEWTTPPADSPQILEVLLNVVALGFRSLARTLHEEPSTCEPNDFVLLTAILQVILRIPAIELLHASIALQFANNNLTGYATSLFSWADRLLINNDPIYGEYAILFLLEMSSVPTIAEGMAVAGVLSQITSADIMQLFSRPKGMGPFDTPTRLHSIWTRGLLPLCLNLLDAVGAPIAGEIVSFLNHFPNQLKRLGTELSNRNAPIGTRPSDSHITFGMASEVHSLSLIWLILERYRDAGAGTGTLEQDIPQLEWDKNGVKEDVDDWVQERRPLGPVVLPGNEREAEFARQKPLKKGASRLEEKILQELVFASECLNGVGA
ncbi:hypothetical protein EJ08DRAFT_647824 [Tothia fuscella]|uniref:Nucleoporin n=1 Tax=Tothia fuscella TaxID=1048955 RepID=A0A9P4NWL8_9PEZI|nr:hypothetical protein EJ08DRAFT_647824 [Tothia fuscella]